MSRYIHAEHMFGLSRSAAFISEQDITNGNWIDAEVFFLTDTQARSIWTQWSRALRELPTIDDDCSGWFFWGTFPNCPSPSDARGPYLTFNQAEDAAKNSDFADNVWPASVDPNWST